MNRSRKFKALVLSVAIGALASSPAQAVPDEGGGPASQSAHPVPAEAFDWADAGVGIGIGVAAGAVAAGSALAVRQRIVSRDAARPAAS